MTHVYTLLQFDYCLLSHSNMACLFFVLWLQWPCTCSADSVRLCVAGRFCSCCFCFVCCVLSALFVSSFCLFADGCGTALLKRILAIGMIWQVDSCFLVFVCFVSAWFVLLFPLFSVLLCVCLLVLVCSGGWLVVVSCVVVCLWFVVLLRVSLCWLTIPYII